MIQKTAVYLLSTKVKYNEVCIGTSTISPYESNEANEDCFTAA
jgi:hypothetical protein